MISAGRLGPRRVFMGLALGVAVLELPAAVEMSQSGFGAGLASLTSTSMDVVAVGLLLRGRVGEGLQAQVRGAAWERVRGMVYGDDGG